MAAIPKTHRPIRSYVLRQGRMTAAQQQALDTLWERYGLAPAPHTPLDLDAVFGRRAPRILEIGFGMGDALAELAAAHPENDYLGIEVHRPGVGKLLNLLDARQINNVRILCADAVEVLARHIPDAGLDAIYLFFPDPWPKRRHAKRRLVQPPFVALVARKLQPGGHFHLATDWEDYARHMLEVLSAAPQFVNAAGIGCYAPRPAYRPQTKFERRGARLGHPVWDLVFIARQPADEHP
ncbi:MAG: tRNA (guanosine(46)-N7)-methyltransferase TrmB [Pseudomonadota bacterium]